MSLKDEVRKTLAHGNVGPEYTVVEADGDTVLVGYPGDALIAVGWPAQPDSWKTKPGLDLGRCGDILEAAGYDVTPVLISGQGRLRVRPGD